MCQQTHYHCPSLTCLSPSWSKPTYCPSRPCPTFISDQLTSESKTSPIKRRCDNCATFKGYLKDCLRAEKERDLRKTKILEAERQARERAEILAQDVWRWNRDLGRKKEGSLERAGIKVKKPVPAPQKWVEVKEDGDEEDQGRRLRLRGG
jgi:hypothetical protein